MNDESKSSSISSSTGPTATRSPLPMGIVVLTLVLLFLGFVYFDYYSGWFDANVYGPYDSTEQLEAYQPKSGAAAALAHGKQVYEQVCGLCHGTDGLGKPGQAPPLAGSEWVNAKGFDRLTHIPLEGLTGQVTVKGTAWNMSMAPMGAGLSDSDLAGVLTYIRTSWGNQGEPVTTDDVNKVRTKIGANPPAITGEELTKMPE